MIFLFPSSHFFRRGGRGGAGDGSHCLSSLSVVAVFSPGSSSCSFPFAELYLLFFSSSLVSRVSGDFFFCRSGLHVSYLAEIMGQKTRDVTRYQVAYLLSCYPFHTFAMEIADWLCISVKRYWRFLHVLGRRVVLKDPSR